MVVFPWLTCADRIQAWKGFGVWTNYSAYAQVQQRQRIFMIVVYVALLESLNQACCEWKADRRICLLNRRQESGLTSCVSQINIESTIVAINLGRSICLFRKFKQSILRHPLSPFPHESPVDLIGIQSRIFGALNFWGKYRFKFCFLSSKKKKS